MGPPKRLVNIDGDGDADADGGTPVQNINHN